MAEEQMITKEDIYLKARLTSEGVRVQMPDALPDPSAMEKEEIVIPDKLDLDDIDGILDLMRRSNMQRESNRFLGQTFILDGSGLLAPVYPNKHSRLDLLVEGDKATISDGGEVLATGRFPPRKEWLSEKISNGMPITTVLPGMSAAIINIVFNLSCMNYNANRGCRYCNLFANPVSKKIVKLPKATLEKYASYQAEAVKIATDNGWRGTLAVSGGALPPAQRGEYLERLELVLSTIREAISEETFKRLRKVYNHYPPEDFSDMHTWKEIGIDATSIDLEVMDDAYFAAICPGKHAYKPLPYWKKAQEASVEIFGPLLHTTGCIVVGIEPMSTLLRGFEDRVSKGVMPLPLMFFSAPGSAYWGFRAPTAEWIVEASVRMVDIFLEHIPKFLNKMPSERTGAGAPGRQRRPLSDYLTTHLSTVPDELQRRLSPSSNWTDTREESPTHA
jgi:hypothetical protein